jgi:guanylate kinase
MEDSTARYIAIGLGFAAVIAIGSSILRQKTGSDKPKSSSAPTPLTSQPPVAPQQLAVPKPKVPSEQATVVQLNREGLTEPESSFLSQHPELPEMLNSLVSSMILHKPSNLPSYSAQYFIIISLPPGSFKPLIISGPSGVGKSTLKLLLMQRYPGIFEFSVSSTTRQLRQGEENGVQYFFITKEEFKARAEEGRFLEWAEVHQNLYGTSREAVESMMDRRKICLLDIDVQGAMQIYSKGLDCNFVFIAPPSIEEIEKRLRLRGTDSEGTLQVRLVNAATEIETAKSHPHIFKDVLVNSCLETTAEEFYSKVKHYYSFLKD